MTTFVSGSAFSLSNLHERRSMEATNRGAPMSESRRDRVRPSGGRSSRRAGPHVNPFGSVEGSSGGETVVSPSSVTRQQFRQRCQAVMARDRQRDRQRRLQSSRGVSCHSDSAHASSDGGSQTPSMLNSDDLYGTDVEADTTFSSYGLVEDDEETMRRVMVIEYRRMLQEQEQQGNMELGWLGPDEVAWLEDELRREEQAPYLAEIEPPPDMVDEDDMLCDMYEHAQSQAQHPSSASTTSGLESDFDDANEDFSWVHDVDLSSIAMPLSTVSERMDTAA